MPKSSVADLRQKFDLPPPNKDSHLKDKGKSVSVALRQKAATTLATKSKSERTIDQTKPRPQALPSVASAEITQHPQVLSDRGKALLVEGLSPSENAAIIDMAKSEVPFIPPVASSVAMQPRVAAMKKPLSEGEYDVEFLASDRILGLFLEQVDGVLCVTHFPRGANDEIYAAEKCGQVGLYDAIVFANGYPLGHYTVDRAIHMIQSMARPLTLRFRSSNKVKQLTDMGFAYETAIAGLSACRGNVEMAANFCFERA